MDKSAKGFIDVTVQPIYGSFRALIKWKVEPKLESATFCIEKSHDGVNSWKRIGTVKQNDFFVDTDLLSQGKLIEQYYRVTAETENNRVTGPVIGTFGTVTRQDFGAARHIMDLEHQSLRRFTKVHIFKLRVFGPPCPKCVDPDTDQAIGTSLCEVCYGTTKEKGYEDPVVSFMRLMAVSPVTQVNSQGGTGASDPSLQVARMLAFPLLRQNDLVVHKEADRRYLVDEVEYSFFGGKIPVVAMVKLQMLPTNDVRFRIPV